MEIIFLSLAAFTIALLTFFSGFGLGTLLTPFLLIYFPIDIAIAISGVLHLFNNVVKWMLIGSKASRKVLIEFGAPAIIAAFAGAWLLLHMGSQKPLFVYTVMERTVEVYPLKLVVALLLILFVLAEWLPGLKNAAFHQKNLALGGVLSGFFGGFAGVQGAFRSAFLVKIGLSPQQFIATTVLISLFVDITRIAVYSTNFSAVSASIELSSLLPLMIAAAAGSFLGNILLKKVTIDFLRHVVASLTLMVALLLAAGVL